MRKDILNLHVEHKYVVDYFKLTDKDYLLTIPENKLLELPARDIYIDSTENRVLFSILPNHKEVSCEVDRNYHTAIILTYFAQEVDKRGMYPGLLVMYDEQFKKFKGTINQLMGLTEQETENNGLLMKSIIYNDCVLVEEQRLIKQYVEEIENA